MIVLRVVIRSPDVETFVEKYSRFIKDDRIFIFTKSSQPMGTRVRFTLQLADAGTALLVGQGVVTRVRQDTGDPGKPPGMEVKFSPLGDDSAKMVQRMLARRAAEMAPPSPPKPAAPPPPPLSPPPSSSSVALPPPQLEGAEPVEMPADRAERTDRNDASPPVIAMEADPGSEEASTLVRDPAATAGPTPLPAPLPLPPLLTPPFGSVPNTLHPTANGSGATPLPAHAPMVAPSLPVLHYTAPSLPALAEAATREEVSAPHSGVSNNTVPARLSASGRVVVEPAPVLPVLDGTSPALSALDEETTERVTPLAGRARRPRERETAPEDDHVVEQPPRVMESWVGPLPAPPGAPPVATAGTVPANPFSDISDGAIEYFIEWSVEQSRQTSEKGRGSPKARFGNVSMKPPRAERKPRPAWVVMVTGVVVGLVAGVPIGGLAMWRFGGELNAPTVTARPAEKTVPAAPTAPAPAPTEGGADAEARNLSGRPRPAATGATAATATAATGTPAAAVPAAPPTAPAPLATAESGDDGERDKQKGGGKLATLRVRSTPDGGEVSVKGTSAATGKRYGLTPIDIELAPGHRYDVVVTLDGYPPFKRRVNLTAPSTEVVAKFR